MSKESTGEAEHGWLPLGSTAAAVPPLPARAEAPARDLAWDAALSCWHHAQGQRGSGRTQGPSLLQTGGGSPGGDAAEQPCGYRRWGGGWGVLQKHCGVPRGVHKPCLPRQLPWAPHIAQGPQTTLPTPSRAQADGKAAQSRRRGLRHGRGWGVGGLAAPRPLT